MYRVAVLLLSLFFVVPIFSENRFFKKHPKDLDIHFSQMNITYPWYMGSYFASYNPYLSLELNRILKSGNRFSLIHPTEIGLFIHKYIENSIFVLSGIGVEFQKNRFFISLDLKGGYLHWFNKRVEYELINGKYEEKANTGNPSLVLGPQIRLGFFSIRDRVTPSISYKWLFQGPFIDEIPIVTHTAIGLDIRIKLGGNNE